MRAFPSGADPTDTPERVAKFLSAYWQGGRDLSGARPKECNRRQTRLNSLSRGSSDALHRPSIVVYVKVQLMM